MLNNVCYLARFVMLLVLFGHQLLWSSAFADDQGSAANVEIDSRERELRRKEEELLRAMDLNSAEDMPAPSSVQETGSSLASSEDNHNSEDTHNKVQVLEIKVPDPEVEAVPLVEDEPKASQLRRGHLKDLEQHPALAPPPKVESAPVVTTNRIRTKTFEEAPDGTTAKRLGSFYRIDRTDFDSTHGHGAKHSQTVPIHQYTATDTARPALLTSDELATIQNASTHLKTGPTRLDSSLLRMPQYSEVRIDYRSGDWYRVQTTQGVRGWVPSSSLLFDSDKAYRSAVRVGGVRRNLEY
jgi:hypothetical protein